MQTLSNIRFPKDCIHYKGLCRGLGSCHVSQDNFRRNDTCKPGPVLSTSQHSATLYRLQLSTIEVPSQISHAIQHSRSIFSRLCSWHNNSCFRPGRNSSSAAQPPYAFHSLSVPSSAQVASRLRCGWWVTPMGPLSATCGKIGGRYHLQLMRDRPYIGQELGRPWTTENSPIIQTCSNSSYVNLLLRKDQWIIHFFLFITVARTRVMTCSSSSGCRSSTGPLCKSTIVVLQGIQFYSSLFLLLFCLSNLVKHKFFHKCMGFGGWRGGGVRWEVYLQQLFQFAALAAEAVQGPILTQAVDPLPPRRDPAAHEVSALPFTGLEGLHHLKSCASTESIACQFCVLLLL